MTKTRIHKLLAAAGVASRRAIEEMIVEGRITVNGQLVKELPCFVDETDEIRLDGNVVRHSATGKKLYFLLNKPKGVVCTQSDPRGRPRAVDLIPPAKERVYCVGRLDEESTGLIILTNDGELTQHLTHPSGQVAKTYTVEVDGRLTGEDMDKLKKGIYLDGKRTSGAAVKILHRGAKRSLLEIRLKEGRNREIRRLLARLGHKVRKLKRVAIAAVTDKGLKVGQYRMLRPDEVRRLRLSGTKRNSKLTEKRNGRGA